VYRLPARLAATAIVACLCAGCPTTAREFEWPTAAPESQGMSSTALASLNARLVANHTRSFLVIRHDRIIHEWYADGHAAEQRHSIASMAKGVVGGVALGVALTDGRIALDDHAATYIPRWRADPRKSRLTLRHLGSHTSGLEDAEDGGVPHGQLTGWKGDFWKRGDSSPDPFTVSRDIAPTRFVPGERFQYSNPGIAMLTYALTAALAGTPHGDIRTLLRDRVMRRIGVADEEWSVGYGTTYTVDGLPLVPAWGGASYTARAVARVARLLLRGGDWEGDAILSPAATRQITADAGTPGHGAIGWWSNNSGKYARLPRDAYWATGAGHQVVLVVPSLGLIAARHGKTLNTGQEHHDALNTHLFQPLLDAVLADPPPKASTAPYPPSAVVRRIEWAAPSTIVRRAKGSDNWPVTWADDDHLYTAYGDGTGFDPGRPDKLSLGFARVEGWPPGFRGVNVRSPTLEQRGDGKAGKKASGLLMVEGVLYLWARNAGNARLAWSHDRGATWTWSDWTFTTSFGAPTFLNFGKNYAGARDGYVYVYSHDHDSAYDAADRMVLARVPSDRITSRDAYEFFKGLGREREPMWTTDIAERGAVFTHTGRCYRSGVTYSAGLQRYLWSQTLPGSDPRFAGGLAIYDAPEPWGPWTTVFYTDAWDVGPGETSSFPTKWMSADGRTLHLVFSGDDHFSVRGATLDAAGSR
jgi:CubicO group peptidase (beta-lactamase class C family)